MDKLNEITKEIDKMAEKYHMDSSDIKLIDKKSEITVQDKLKSLECKGLSDIQSEALNNVLHYCVENQIKVSVSNGINYLEDMNDIEIQNQINISFRKNFEYDLFSFFFGTEDSEIMFSAIVEFKELDDKIYDTLNSQLEQMDLNPFNDLLCCEEDNTLHLFGRLEFDKVNDVTLNKINKIINGVFMDLLIKLSELSKEEIYKELNIK